MESARGHFVKMLVKLKEDCDGIDLEISDYGFTSDDIPKTAQNVKDTWVLVVPR